MLVASGCTTTTTQAKPASAATCGSASWYGGKFHGRRTASGKVFNQNAMTAAHRTLPFGTKIHVTHGGKSAIVTITDRGPFAGKRILDLSRGAASEIGLKRKGVGKICYQKVK